MYSLFGIGTKRLRVAFPQIRFRMSESSGTGARRGAFVARGESLFSMEHSLARLSERSSPAVVTIVGPLGMGKTRLIDEYVSERRRRADARVLRTACQEAEPPYGPISRLLRERFGLDEVLSVTAAHEQVRRIAGKFSGDRRVADFVHFLAMFLDLEIGQSPLTTALDDDEAVTWERVMQSFAIFLSATPVALRSCLRLMTFTSPTMTRARFCNTSPAQ